MAFAMIGAVSGQAQTTISIKFVNHSGYDDDEVYLYVTGASPMGYYDFATKKYVTARVASVDTMTASLKEVRKHNNNTLTFPLPAITSGRIYFSYGANFGTLAFNSVNGTPVFFEHDQLPYDKLEFDTSDLANLNINTTNVDYYGLPSPSKAKTKRRAASRMVSKLVRKTFSKPATDAGVRHVGLN